MQSGFNPHQREVGHHVCCSGPSEVDCDYLKNKTKCALLSLRTAISGRIHSAEYDCSDQTNHLNAVEW